MEKNQHTVPTEWNIMKRNFSIKIMWCFEETGTCGDWNIFCFICKVVWRFFLSLTVPLIQIMQCHIILLGSNFSCTKFTHLHNILSWKVNFKDCVIWKDPKKIEYSVWKTHNFQTYFNQIRTAVQVQFYTLDWIICKCIKKKKKSLGFKKKKRLFDNISLHIWPYHFQK